MEGAPGWASMLGYVCGLVIAVAGAINWIVKGIIAARKPEKQIKDRIANIETIVARHDEFLSKDKERLDAIEEGNRVTHQALLALLSHGIDGNNVEEMRAAKSNMQEYLIKR